MTAFSDEHDVALSKVFDRAIFAAGRRPGQPFRRRSR
jgi:hypothetical protein